MEVPQKPAQGAGRLVPRRQIRIGANAMLMTIVFIAILVLINVIAVRFHRRWDLTATKDFSLSQQSIQILEGLQHPVQIIGFFGKQDAGQRDDVESRLKEYTSHSKQVSYRFIDPDTDPVTARTYNITSYGTLVVESEGRRQQATGTDEQAITTALLKVTQNRTSTVYFLTGHKEPALDGTDQNGYSTIKNALQQDNFEVAPLNLTITPTIPLSDTVLVVADPQTALSQSEEQSITTYVNRGGRVLVLGNALVEPPLTSLLNRAGLKWNNDVVVDQQSALGNPAAPAVVQYPPSSITKDLTGQATVFPTVRTVSEVDNPPEDITITLLLQSSNNSQAASDFSGGQLKLSQNDKRGPLPFGYSVEGVIRSTGTVTNPLTTPARLIVVGDADFASNGTIATAQANTALFRNMIAWLAAQDQLISLPAKVPTDHSVFLTAGQSQAIFYGNTIGIPLLILLIGGIVWWRRR